MSGPAPATARALAALGIRRLATDSRLVRRGDTFLAYPGERLDGRRFIGQAIAGGAASVVWDARDFRWNPRWRVPNVAVASLRRHAGEIAGRVYGQPSRSLWMVGITGTNGKTSCSQWVAQALTHLGRNCAVVGTLGYGMPGRLRPTPNTTPDAVWLQRTLAGLARRDCAAVSMEVSSIGLAQDRTSGIEFDVAMLTNLTRDHLDYHGTIRRYKAAKARLFAQPGVKHAVLNADDAFGAELAGRVQRRDINVIGYGFARRARLPRGAARVAGRNLEVTARGLAFDVDTPWGRGRLESPLVGRFNASNLLGCLAVLLASDMRLEESLAALARVVPPPGRLERLGGGGRPLVVIDYAHSPDALENALGALSEIVARGGVPARLTCVFGCGGERDRGKRPQMGAIAARLADRVIVTSDNPRGEDPRRIAAEIAAGARSRCEIELDRARAIRAAVADAAQGDVILVAGKGHETYQEVAGRRLPFRDQTVAAAALARWRP